MCRVIFNPFVFRVLLMIRRNNKVERFCFLAWPLQNSTRAKFLLIIVNTVIVPLRSGRWIEKKKLKKKTQSRAEKHIVKWEEENYNRGKRRSFIYPIHLYNERCTLRFLAGRMEEINEDALSEAFQRWRCSQLPYVCIDSCFIMPLYFYIF